MEKSILNLDHIYTEVEVENQKQAFQFIANKFFKQGYCSNERKAFKGLVLREKQGTTGFNDGVAIPHAKIKQISKPGVFIFKFKKGVEWNSIDGSDVRLAIALAIPELNSELEHIKILSSIARKLVDDAFITALHNTTSKQALFDLVKNIEIK